MKVYIVRHGQIPHNVTDTYGPDDEDIDEVGIRQAEELRNKIKDMPFDIIFCSPMVRARHTADIINANDLPIVYDDRLKERDCGSLCEQPYIGMDREEYWHYGSTIQYGTSENMKAFFERVFVFLNELKGKEYQRVLIVAHSGTSKAFSAYFNGLQDGWFLHRGLGNCEIKEYTLLKFCPFCGSNMLQGPETTEREDRLQCRWTAKITCLNCFASITNHGFDWTEGAAIDNVCDAWNRRATN